MAPDAEDCEEMERLSEEYQEVPVHQGRRILPEESQLVQAWVENEEAPGNDSRTNSPGENRRLLGNKQQIPNSRLQAGLTLGVWGVPKKSQKCVIANGKIIPKERMTFQKRKERLIEAWRPPYFIITMIILIVCLHLSGPDSWRRHLEWIPGAWWKQPWRLFTYGFVHASATHLALNALVSLAVGWRLEHEQGWIRVAVVWCAGVVAGALGAGALQPSVRVVGASAAVYALLTAHLPNVCLRFGHIPLWWFRPLSVIVLSASEGCWTLMQVPKDDPESNRVAWSAHVLGALIGIPLGFIVFTGENRENTYVSVCRRLSCIILIAGVFTTIAYYVFWHEDHYT